MTDIPESLVRFAARLREAGLPLGTDQVQCFAAAVTWIDWTSAATFRRAARATLVTRCDDLRVFDAVFDAFWGLDTPRGQPTPQAPRHDPAPHQPALVTWMSQRAGAADPEVDVPDRSRAASPEEVLRSKDFSRLTEAERAEIHRLLDPTRWHAMMRTTRRRRPDRRRGEPDLRVTLRRATRQGGVPLDIVRRRRTVKPRPLVVLADISGSMELYTRIFLQFVHTLGHRWASDVETFVFATELTRITADLDPRDPDAALDRVTRRVRDFSGGTRIGESVRAFNTLWAGRVLRRGAIVLVMSDGCDCGDVHLLRGALRSLRDRTYRLIWLNPRLGHHAYAPEVAGMSAALEFVDDFLAANNLHSLGQLAAYLGSLPRRRSK